MRRSNAHYISRAVPSRAKDDNEYVPDSESEGESQMNSGRKRVGDVIDRVSDSDNEENAPGRLAKLILHDKQADKCAARRNRKNKSRRKWRKNVQRGKDTLDHAE